MLETTVAEGLEGLGVSYDRDAIPRLRRYFELLEETNKVMNLTAISGEENVARLHFLDCAAILTENDISGKTVIDVGTGAGFPGMVLRILRPDSRMILVDSLDKRIGFLRKVCEETGLVDGTILIHGRAEEVVQQYRGKADIVVSRAVAGLNILAEMCLPYVRTDGVFMAMKGPDYEEELSAAKKAIKELGGKTEKCVSYTIPGTDISHSLINIRKIAETPLKYPRRWSQIKKAPL